MSAAFVELLAADEAYDQALADLQESYRDATERGYLEAKFTSARELGERFVRAQIRREKAIAACKAGMQS